MCEWHFVWQFLSMCAVCGGWGVGEARCPLVSSHSDNEWCGAEVVMHCTAAFNRQYSEMDNKLLALTLFMDPRYKSIADSGGNFRDLIKEVRTLCSTFLEVPFSPPSYVVIYHCMRIISNVVFNNRKIVIITIPATSPLRTPGEVRET